MQPRATKGRRLCGFPMRPGAEARRFGSQQPVPHRMTRIDPRPSQKSFSKEFGIHSPLPRKIGAAREWKPEGPFVELVGKVPV